jgi:hypothetical protein
MMNDPKCKEHINVNKCRCRVLVKSEDPEARMPGFFLVTPVINCVAKYLSFLCLSFISCKMEIKVIQSYRIVLSTELIHVKY